jgi:hypothetical protein
LLVGGGTRLMGGLPQLRNYYNFGTNKAYSLEASSNWQGMLTLIDSYDNITF